MIAGLVQPPTPLADATVTPPRTKAFFFDSAAQPLFGLYGPPQSHEDHDHGVLLCAPIGHEYMRSHWCLRLLGDQLIQSGFHVLRFDYSCLGDSWGTFEQASVEQWTDDVVTAVGELQDNAGVRHITIVGLRLGAALACLAAQKISCHQLVLWDPVLDGSVYLAQLRTMQAHLLHDWPYAPVYAPGAEYEELLGYRYPAALIQRLSALKLEAAPAAERISLVLDAKDAAGRQYHDQLRQLQIPGALREVEELGAWDAVENDLYAEPRLLPNMRRAVTELLQEAVR